MTENANSYTYFPNSNKLGSANGKSYGYDSNGNTIGESTRTFGYNDNQRLVTVSDAGATYVYNGNGQRVKKVVNGTATVFHYSLAGQIIAESDSSGTITAEYVYLNSQPLAKIEGTSVFYYHNDHLGTPQKLTDSTGTVVWSADYKPFGEATVTVSTVTNNLRFPGQYFDAETALNYNYFRDYNPAIGRYIEADQVGIKGGENHLFIYVQNTPVNEVDPSGLEVKTCKRPLAGHEKIYGKLYHEFIVVNSLDYGFFCKGCAVYGDGEVRGPGYETDFTNCKPVSCIDESKLLNNLRASQSHPEHYNIHYFSCQEWAAYQLARARKPDCCH